MPASAEQPLSSCKNPVRMSGPHPERTLGQRCINLEFCTNYSSGSGWNAVRSRSRVGAGSYAFLVRARFHICGRLHKRKKNLRDCIARSQVLTSVRPLLRPFSCRGPVWEFADRVQITATRSKARCEKLASRSRLSLTVRHTLLSTLLRLRRLLIAGGFKTPRPELDRSLLSPVRPKPCAPSCWQAQRLRASAAYVPASAQARTPMGCRV